MHSDKTRGTIAFLFLLGVWLGGVTPAVSVASRPKAVSDENRGVVRVLDPVGALSAPKATVPPAQRLNGFSGKKVWVIVVDSGSTLMPAVAKLLPQFASGAQVMTIQAGEKGNPFFLLKPKNRPDAVIAGTGVCGATTLEAANYAKQAEKLDIPAVISFNGEILNAYQEAIKKLLFPALRAYATNLPNPSRAGDPEGIAKRLIPQFIDGLTRPAGFNRSRICFTGTEEKARAYFEKLGWTGGYQSLYRPKND